MRTWCYVWLWASESLSSPVAIVPVQVCLLQWCCSVGQALPGWSLRGLDVTMSLCADRKGRCEYDIPSSFLDGPVESYWEKSSQLFRPVISWRAGPVPGWPRILSLLPLCSTPEAFAAVSGVLAFRRLVGR